MTARDRDRERHESTRVAGNTSAGNPEEFESLYYEIGRRAQVAATQPEGTDGVEPTYHESVIQEISATDVINSGRRLYKRIEFSARGLICGDSADDNLDREDIQQRLMQAASYGADNVETLLAGILTSHLGLGMFVAAPAAKLIVKRVLRPSMEEMGRVTADSLTPKVHDLCKRWIVVLREREATTAATPAS